MLKSLSVQRFRSLRNVELSSLSMVNIIVGRSAAGKTALLEALRIASSPLPSTIMSVIMGRGAVYRGMFVNGAEYYDFLSSIFTDYNRFDSILIGAASDRSFDREVSIGFDFSTDLEVTPAAVGGSAPPVQPFLVSPLQVSQKISGSPDFTRVMSLDKHGWLDWGSREPALLNGFFGSSWDASSSQVAQWYSELSVFNRELDINAAIMEIYPEIINLSIQNAGSSSVLHAAVKGITRKIPLSNVSAGINKLVSILISIKRFENDIVLIDEVENGFFYRTMPQMWEVVHSFARSSNVQIFVSTHSLECLRAAGSVISSHPSDFSLVQVQHTDGGSRYLSTPGKNAGAAIEGGLEVRR